MQFSTATVFLASALAGLSSAVSIPGYHGVPTGENPFTGNPTSFPAAHDKLPKGEVSTIKWAPSTAGTVSIALFSGTSPSTLDPMYTIANKIANSGSFAWTPASALNDDVLAYGLMIIDDATGQFQWSPPFNIKDGKSAPAPAPASKAVAPKSAASYAVSSAATVPAVASYTAVPPVVSQITDGQPQAPKASAAKYSYITSQMTTTICPTASAPAATAPAASVAASYPVAPAPPASVVPAAPSASAPAGTAPAPATTSPIVGAAGKNMIATGAVFAAVLAAFAL